jgi:hypothetical protein
MGLWLLLVCNLRFLQQTPGNIISLNQAPQNGNKTARLCLIKFSSALCANPPDLSAGIIGD